MFIRVGINGFGRIGRCVLRALVESGRDDVCISAINSRSDINIAAHLLRYDSTHGRFAASVEVSSDALLVNGNRIPYSRHTNIDDINWQATDTQLVMECSGIFTARDDAARHLQAGAQQVLISAPGKNSDATVVYGVNHSVLTEKKCAIVSAASCTTNCLAPVAQTLHNNVGIECGWMSTVHASTNDQKILDESHKDLRRARAAGESIILTKTGAAAAVGLVIPELAGKLNGVAARVPVKNVSLVDLTCLLANDTDANAINDMMRKAAANMPTGVMTVNDEPLVSSDF
jgi:glyceraldehyde 3-phosphate dehydrogenase